MKAGTETIKYTAKKSGGVLVPVAALRKPAHATKR